MSFETAIVQPPVTAIAPNNPAGIESLLRSVRGGVCYFDLNESLFLDWCLTESVLREIIEGGALKDKRILEQSPFDFKRIEEVVGLSEEAKAAFSKLDTYRDFEKYVKYKRVLEDAATLVSLPFLTEREIERISIHHNTIDYYNNQFNQSRRDLLRLSASAGLYKGFIESYAAPAILAGNPGMVGISITHADQYVFAFQLAKRLREVSPKTILLFGGNTISRRLDTWSKDDEMNRNFFRESRADGKGLIDGLIVSEGELAIAELTYSLVENSDLDLSELFANVNGVVYNHGGKIEFNTLPPAFRPEKLWEEEVDIYASLTPGFMPEGKQVRSICDGRVCTFECGTGGCDFCGISKGNLELVRQRVKALGLPQNEVIPMPNELSRRLEITPEAVQTKRGIRIIEQRRLGAERMADEIAAGSKNGFPIVDIVDEQFTLDHALELGRALHARGVNIEGASEDVGYSCYMRIDDAGDPTNYKEKYGKSLSELLTDPAIAVRLYRGGLRFAQFGLESTFPPKMQAMVKGTSRDKVETFAKILQNLGDNGVMSHVFIIVGAPYTRKRLEEGMYAFKTEEEFLGRESITVSQLEILEAIYNVDFLRHVSDTVYTVKSTQFKLDRLSPQAGHPGDFGISVREKSDQERDIGLNVPFKYEEGCGPAKQVLKDLLRFYDLWKQEVMPYQPVTQEYLYSQRVLIGSKRIQEIAGELFPVGEIRLSEAEKIEKAEVLHRLWKQLVGEKFAKQVEKLSGPNGNSKPLREAVEKARAESPMRQEFPNGFTGYEDLYSLAGLLSARRQGEHRKN